MIEDEIEKYEQDDNKYNMDYNRILEENINNNKSDTFYELISFEKIIWQKK